jgi:methylthioribose-1-phosphate isomerase
MRHQPDIKTIIWDKRSVRIIDQTRLPDEVVHLTFTDYRQVIEAIQNLRIRGAPAIALAGAFGVVLGVQASACQGYDDLRETFERIAREFVATRPTGVNLSKAIERLDQVMKENKTLPVDDLTRLLESQAVRLYEEDREVCRAIGRHGATLLREGWTVLTHCNAGALATADYGTAIGCIYAAWEQGKRVSVYVDETRPQLQGARLTAWELQRADIPVTVICDNMAAWMMKTNKIQCVLVGADRIASNGDTANKIGTYALAIIAKEHDLPFYVAAPMSTFDLSLQSGDDISIEERDGAEIADWYGRRITPSGIQVRNPSFDITPGSYITSFISEKGIISPPYNRDIFRDVMRKTA